MTPSPIHRVLSTMRTHAIQSLLMGGQACILYGAAEFSRDVDFAIVADRGNLQRLQGGLEALDAAVIAVPPFEARYLDRGHAIHFRCNREDVRGIRVDVMSRMRGVDPFSSLWARRTTMRLLPPGPARQGDVLDVDVLALSDLVAAKKTQRDKDWPMIRRLVEANYFEFRERADDAHAGFWLRELRTPELLIECAATFPELARTVANDRQAVRAAIHGDVSAIDQTLAIEQSLERERDRVYWAPLRAELADLRRFDRHSSAE